MDYLKKNWAFLAGALVVFICFCHFVLPSLNAGFRGDDAYNIYYYWSRGPWPLVKNLLLFFSTYYRPMGGVYYLPLYELFGLNPFPYHVAIAILIFINVILAYRCATLLSKSRIVGGLCSFLMVYHARMVQLLYVPAFIYDVLCFTFFFGAFFYYLRIRCSGKELNWRSLLIFIVLYVAALESKEMAVSLPALLLAYELLWHPPGRPVTRIWQWLRSTGVPIVVSGAATLAFITGKFLGPEPLSNNPLYHPTITFGRFLESNVRFAKDIFYLKPEGWFNEQWLLIVWALLAYLAITRRSRHLQFALIMILVAPLPIAFIPGRGNEMLYIPLFGWALIVATLVETVCSSVSREPLFRHLNAKLARAVPLLLAVICIWQQTNLQHRKVTYGLQLIGQDFWSVKQQLETLLPAVKPGTQMVFYNDIFRDWSAKFIAELLYKDRSVTVRLNEKWPLSPSEWTKADYVLAFDKENKLLILKRPGEDFKPLE
ncbi:MAG: hypothetical protein H6Q07_864 [Acidobacteria bacterium]|nr:hypothetical protein [Acidobacteriota bacterium]